MGIFGNLDKLVERAKSRTISLEETGMVVAPVEALSVGQDNGNGLEFDATVVLSHIEGIEEDTVVRIQVTGGDEPIPAKKMFDNIEQGAKADKVTMEQLVLEKVKKTGEVDGKPVITARWANKAAGSDRAVISGITGPETINFNYQMDDGKSKHVTIVVGDNNEERMQQLETQLGRWQRAMESGIEKEIDKTMITVSHISCFPDMATIAAESDDMFKALESAVEEGSNMAFVRLFDQDTKDAVVISIYLKGKDGLKNRETLAADFEQAVIKSLRSNSKVGDLLKTAKAEVIPAIRMYMANNKSDFSKNSTAKYVGEYIKMSDSQKDFLQKVQPRGHYMPKIIISTMFATDEKGGDDESIYALGGYIKSIVGTTEGASRVIGIETNNVSGLKSLPKDPDKAVAGNDGDPADEASQSTSESTSPKQEAEQQKAEDPGNIEDFDEIPDFSNEQGMGARARP